jgi:tyrosyl-tRNA synthetase
MTTHATAPEKRNAQQILAEEVVTLVHGTQLARRCMLQTAALFPEKQVVSGNSPYHDFRPGSILEAFRGDDVMLRRIPTSAVLGQPLSRLLKDVGLVKSNSSIPSNLYLTAR